MAKETINIGTSANKGDGDPLRTAFTKINSNFTELYDRALNTDSQTLTLTGTNLAISGGNSVDLSSLSGSGTGDITFAATTISAPNQDEIVIQSKDSNSFGTARVTLNSEFGGDARLRAFSSESVDTFTLANGDFATGVWQDNGFGNGVVSFTGAQGIGDFFQNTLFKLTPDNVTITINNEPEFTWNGGANGSGTDTPGFGTNPIVPATPITITSIVFRYRSESFISVNYDNQEIRLNVQNGGIVLDANNTIQMFGDSNIELQSGSDFSINSGQNISIGTGSADSIGLSTGDLNFTAFDDVNFRGSDSFRIRNTSATAPIRIITDDNNTQRTWAFRPDGRLAFPTSVAPVSSKGAVGDQVGSVTFDNTYIYYCTADYTDGLADIWKRVSWSADTW